MNWFERHLNWSLVLYYTAIVVLNWIVWIGLIFYFGIETTPPIFLSPPAGLIALFVVWWHIGKKGRSRWWIFLLLLSWLGVGILLLLENKNAYANNPVSIELSKIWKYTDNDEKVVSYSSLESIKNRCSLCSHFDNALRFTTSNMPWCVSKTAPNIVQDSHGNAICKSHEVR